MTGFLPKEKLTAYQRWEVAAFDEAEAAKSARESQAALPEAEPQVALPTAAQIERDLIALIDNDRKGKCSRAAIIRMALIDRYQKNTNEPTGSTPCR